MFVAARYQKYDNSFVVIIPSMCDVAIAFAGVLRGETQWMTPEKVNSF
jgi:hypothetical protein